MKKLLLLSILLMAACDDNSHKQSSNTSTQTNTNTTRGLLSSLTQRDVEFFKNNTAERTAVLQECIKHIQNDGTISQNAEECYNAANARAQVSLTGELNGDISVKGFKQNHDRYGSADLDAALYCSADRPLIPLDHPICKAIIEYARQLRKECMGRAKSEFDCIHLEGLFARLQIKE